jgi:hypothetical protein
VTGSDRVKSDDGFEAPWLSLAASGSGYRGESTADGPESVAPLSAPALRAPCQAGRKVKATPFMQ